jgi:hypothetical protein
LLRYDRLTADDVEELKANYVAPWEQRGPWLSEHRPREYKDQDVVFVRAIGELRDADGLCRSSAEHQPDHREAAWQVCRLRYRRL